MIVRSLRELRQGLGVAVRVGMVGMLYAFELIIVYGTNRPSSQNACLSCLRSEMLRRYTEEHAH